MKRNKKEGFDMIGKGEWVVGHEWYAENGADDLYLADNRQM